MAGNPQAQAASRERVARLALLLAGASPATAALGFLLGSPILLPILSAAPAYAGMVLLLSRGRRGVAVGIMLAWALLHGAAMTGLCSAWPERAGQVVIHGPAYWTAMSTWLETGQGTESSPATFLPQHLLHAVAFAALSIATGSLVSILFGAILMNYMSYYVAQVVLRSARHPALAALLAWHPWSVVRIVAFVTLGVILAEPVLSRLQGRPRPIGRGWRWIALAFGGLVLDVALKVLFAPHWPALLRSLR